MTLDLKHIVPKLPSWFWIGISGVTGGLMASATSLYRPLAFVAFFPLFLVLDRIVSQQSYSKKKKLGLSFLSCWATAIVFAPLAVQWMTNSINVFGHMPWLVALLITSFVYGFEITMILWFCFGLPAFLVKQRNGWDIPFRLCFFLIVDWWYPRFFSWSFGGRAFFEVPWISQVADLVGSWGLGFYSVGVNFLLLMLWRVFVGGALYQKKQLTGFVLFYLSLLGLGSLYGAWRTNDLQKEMEVGSPLHVASVQPNFSLRRLASNPDLAYSVRDSNIRGLLSDSKKALSRFSVESAIPRLVIWPESTFPYAYYKSPQVQKVVQRFAQEHNTSILLNSVDWEENLEGTKFYGTSLLVGNNGQIQGRYNKIFLIPFGEYIPGASWFPSFRHWLRSSIPNMSEFERGEEYTVFHISDQLALSGAICFDVFSPDIIRNMTRNGADFIVALSNLAWFGKSNASLNMELAIHWRAIENRVPVLIASNNGETVFLNVLGQRSSEAVALFEEGSLSETVYLKSYTSFYRNYREWVHWSMVVLLILVAWIAYRNNVFHSFSDE